MVELLESTADQSANPENIFANSIRINHFDSLFKATENHVYLYEKGRDLLNAGHSEDAAKVFSYLLEYTKTNSTNLSLDQKASLRHNLALSYLRLGEQENCILNHTSASCLYPIQEEGYHSSISGSSRAINNYRKILEMDSSDLSARWLLNIAYMTLGQYPDSVPSQWLIKYPNIDTLGINSFKDVANHLNFDIKGLSGGLVVDDFNGDNYYDILVSEWGAQDQLRYFEYDQQKGFVEKTERANLKGITGGLNMLQADYNNDGKLDVLILRGAWLKEYGAHPNSLLKNNGDGTFTDITIIAGLLSYHPTQTATWNDFNQDGWLDLFIGNESSGNEAFHYSELFINNQDGTFTEIAEKAGVRVNQIGFNVTKHYIKGVTSGDYDNDGWPDIYISTGGLQHERNFLFKNLGLDKEGTVHFKDVTRESGLLEQVSTFTTWFWDYNNDGWLDIFAAGYRRSDGEGSITTDIAAEYLGKENTAEKGRIYKNNGDGTFTNVSSQTKLDKILYSMGANYGDINNDGWLDFYLGTGNIGLSSIIPNKLFLNLEGKYFADITTPAGVGHLQKGHAVSFADIDYDGDQDIIMSMGGAYEGDIYQNSLFENPYSGQNSWIKIKLSGVKSNSSAIGSRLEIQIDENGRTRKIFREYSSGGSFGCSPLESFIGLEGTTKIIKLIVYWPNGYIQMFEDLPLNETIKITEGKSDYKIINRKKYSIKNINKITECID